MGDTSMIIGTEIIMPDRQGIPEAPLGELSAGNDLLHMVLEALGAEPPQAAPGSHLGPARAEKEPGAIRGTVSATTSDATPVLKVTRPPAGIKAPAAPKASPASAPNPPHVQQAADRAYQEARNGFLQVNGANLWKPSILSEGRKDVMSGTQANEKITAGYAAMDQKFAQYVGNGVEPPLANWLAFGKYASNEAGQQIRLLEKVLNTVGAGPGSGTQPVGLADLKQGLEEAFGPRGLPMLTTLAKQFAESKGIVGTALSLTSPLLGGAEFAHFATSKLVDMRNTLVKGNTGIYGDIFPAYEAFLAAENAGGDGVAELKRLGFDKGPNHFVIDAFKEYQKAKGIEGEMVAIDAKLQGLPPGAERDALSKQRDALAAERQEAMFKGNTLVGFKEQMDVLEKNQIFENNAGFQELITAMGGKMELNLANGEKFPLLPQGGDWTDFATRMGLTEYTMKPNPMPANVIEVQTPQGRTTWFKLPSSTDRTVPEGTIAYMFQKYASGENARRLHEGTPPKQKDVPIRPADLVAEI